MQNFNDGKAQEFKDRKVYDIGLSMNRRFGQGADENICVSETPAQHEAQGRLVLFTTSTCPKCVMAKKFLADAGLAYETVIVDVDPEAARKFGVRQAPTLLVLDGEQAIDRVENPSNIRAFAEKHAK